MKKKICIGILVLLVIIQFFRVDYTNPASEPTQDFLTVSNPTENIKASVKNACYDCHSNQTTYPWYSQVAPISWWTKNHVTAGREHLNFSEWGSYSSDEKKHKIQESIEEIEKGKMPLKSYTWLHGNAKLSDQEKEELIGWLKQLQP